MSLIPSIDISCFLNGTDKYGIANQLARACEDIGFFTITGHGVSDTFLQNVSDCAFAFFDQPHAIKDKLIAPGGMGYMRVGGEALAATIDGTIHDYKESLNLALPPVDTQWPQETLWSNTFLAYFNAMYALSANLMRIFAMALQLDENWFNDKIDHASAILRLLNYPPMPEIKPGTTWAGAHTDYGILTILWSPNSSGLQAQMRTGEWVDVRASRNAFIINIGDLMMNWTNDRWVSNLHRVVPSENDLNRRRQSIPFFYNPNPDALIECLPTCKSIDHPPKYQPILARDHLQMKISKAVKM
jgi:isopenicillin N synthase-like dioxygenase